MSCDMDEEDGGFAEQKHRCHMMEWADGWHSPMPRLTYMPSWQSTGSSRQAAGRVSNHTGPARPQVTNTFGLLPSRSV